MDVTRRTETHWCSFRGARKVAACLLAMGALGLTGCNNNKTKALETENQELRGHVTQLESALNEAESAKAQLAQENEALRSENESLRTSAGPRRGGGGSSSDTVIEVAGDVLFDSGKAVVKESAKAQLNQIARRLNSEFAGHFIRVEGHTDTDPIRKSKWASNEALSQARAEAVMDYLVSRGVDPGRISAIGLGSAKPKGTKAASRRVEIVVLGG